MTTSDSNVQCPSCGAGMVLRTATKGAYSGKQFYGCSRFPRCKGTRNTAISETQSKPQNFEADVLPHERNPFLLRTVLKAGDQGAKKTPLTEIQKRELAKLRDRLLNLSSRNRSIRLNKLDKKSAFDLSALNGFDSSLVNRLVEHCLNEDDEIKLLPTKNQLNEKLWDQLAGNLTHLARNISEIYQEKGIRDLYVGFPFLSGRPSGSDTIIQAPIFLIPVELERSVPKRGLPTWTLKPNADQRIFFNKTLFHALAKLCNLTVNQNIFEEEVPKDLYGEQNFVQWTHKLLQEYGVISTIHADALDQVFDRLPEFKLGELTEELETLQVRQNAVLGHFPQSNSSLQKDYEAFLSMSQEDLEGITCFLTEESTDEDFDDAAIAGAFDFLQNNEESKETIDSRPESENFFLLPSDSSQDKIVMELSKQSTDGIVVWGPPGTGKSQTIVNLIADCVSKGKTVLLVSQKRAALDVVYDRLGSRNMNSIAAVVHDSKDDRKDLYKKVAGVCNEETQSSDRLVDPSPEIASITSTLKEITAVYNDRSFDRKAGLIFQELAAERENLLEDLDSSWASRKFNEVDQVAQTLGSFQHLPRPQIDDRFAKSRNSFANLDPQLKLNVTQIVSELRDAEEVRLAVATARLLSDRSDSFTNASITRLKTAKDYLNQNSRFARFFDRTYWRSKAELRRAHSHSLKIRSNLTKRTRAALAPFVSNELCNAVDFNNDLESAIDLLHSAETMCVAQFDALKSLDSFREKLPLDVQALEDKLMSLRTPGMYQDWSVIFRRSVYSLWFREIERKHPVLSAIKSGQADVLRERLAMLLRSKTEYAASLLQKRLKLSLNSKAGKEASRSVAAEVERKRNIPSIRKLNEKFIADSYFKSMIPVWLVSPETVSDVFPLTKGLFDVVIFDEASQCTVECGLPAIFRGKQIVIAGDEKQLPPSKTFEATIEESNDDESFASNEQSLLTLAKKTLRYKAMMLEWHYRSKHQELVTFSNEVFYAGRMKIAPNVIPFTKGNRPAIEWHSVEGYWNDRCNDEEAKRVVELIRSHLESASLPSIGVITFNVNQKTAILDLIDDLEQNDPDFALLLMANRKRPMDERLFVKNIENVQGDERDIIIFSIAYAPSEPGGRVRQNFGLLNQPGGENRLNVAVTRAISHIHIVASINPETELNTSTSLNAGPKIFHKYLCFAKAVAEENFDRVDSILAELNPNLSTRPQTGHLHFDSPFEEDVFNELTLHGYEVHSQVGQSGFRIDLAVVDKANPGRYVLGIECDGAMYHSSVSVRERDVFRQRFLESRGWKIHRVWSPSWRDNRRRELKKILDTLGDSRDLNADSKKPGA